MNKHEECLCICPPSPDLEAKILSTKQKILQETGHEDIDEIDILDMSTFTLIINRPKKTRSHDHAVSSSRAPVVGTKRALVLLVDFSDKAANKTQSHYSNLLFSQGTHATGSMRDYFKEVSYNKLNVIGAVAGQNGPTAGWFRAPRTKAYYTNNDFGFGSYPRNAQKCVEDVIDLAAPHVDFSIYDNDGDGFVEALIVICAGSGGEASGNKSDFWSHKWGIAPKTVNGVKVNKYFMAPEDGRVGVMAHELGHLLLGLPDLYDTDYSSKGTGRWDLMAGGSWNNGGHTPAHPTAWCKLKCGWVAPNTVFNDTKNVTVKPYHNNQDIIKLPIGNVNSKEYFLISNRQKNGFDSHLPGEGMLIEHVDDNIGNNTNENHYLVDIEQADGKRDLNNNSNSGDADDVFPFGSKNSFTNTSNPNSKNYAGADSKVKVTSIARSGDNVTATISSGTGGTSWVTKKVVRTYASPHSKNAWASLQGVGWRKVEGLSTNGVTNTFALLVEARVKNKTVTASIDNNHIKIAYLN